MSEFRAKLDEVLNSIGDALEKKANELESIVKEKRLAQLKEDLAELKKRENDTPPTV